MKRSSWIALAAAALLLTATGFLLLRATGPPPRSADLIREALRDAENAARERNWNGVMEVISDSYKDPAGLTKDKLRVILVRSAQLVRSVKYDVRVSAPKIEFDKDHPDRASIVTSVSVLDAAGGGELWAAPGIKLTMRKESRRRHLVFTEDRWRITSGANLPSAPGSEDPGGAL